MLVVNLVLAYRCGAAPDSHRVPFKLGRNRPSTSTGCNVLQGIVKGQPKYWGPGTIDPPYAVYNAVYAGDLRVRRPNALTELVLELGQRAPGAVNPRWRSRTGRVDPS